MATNKTVFFLIGILLIVLGASMLAPYSIQVIYGENIERQLNPVKTGREEILVNKEPEAFNFGDINNSGVMSDNYSFLDQSIEALSAKGNGGLRQLRNNVQLDYTDQIETPPDNYVPNKIGEVSMEKLQQSRDQIFNKN